MDWKEYQQKVGNIFSKLGCQVDINKPVKGARGKHEVDVYVRFKVHGVSCKWVIECKYWKRSVSKEKVLVLQKIVEDIGADRGILVSEQGFQSGAISSSINTNITLSSLEELKKISKKELFTKMLNDLNDQIIILQERVISSTKRKRINRSKLSVTVIMAGNTKKFYSDLGFLSILEATIKDIKRNKKIKRYPLKISEDGEKLIVTENLSTFLEQARETLNNINSWYGKAKKKNLHLVS